MQTIENGLNVFSERRCKNRLFLSSWSHCYKPWATYVVGRYEWMCTLENNVRPSDINFVRFDLQAMLYPIHNKMLQAYYCKTSFHCFRWNTYYSQQTQNKVQKNVIHYAFLQDMQLCAKSFKIVSFCLPSELPRSKYAKETLIWVWHTIQLLCLEGKGVIVR